MIRARISDLANGAAVRFGRKPAFSAAGELDLSFAELDVRAGRVAGALAACGIGAGDRVVLHLPNGWEWVVTYHALARLGAVVVPANILLAIEEVAFMAEDAEANAMIIPAERREGFGGNLQVFTLGSATRATSLEALLSGDYKEPVERETDDLFTIGYTSGTTGKPKGAMISHGGLFASLAGTSTLHVRSDQDVVLTSLPFPHVYGNIVMNSTFLVGSRLVAMARFDAGEALALIGQQKATLFEGVPTMYYQMLVHPEIGAARLSSLTRCTVGGQKMPTSKIEAVSRRFGCPLLELWGMTEVAGPAITHSPYWPPRPGSIGLPMPGLDIRLIALDDPSREAAAHEAGELTVRGTMVTGGYWRNPKATADAIDDGWLKTGDIAKVDAEGYIYIIDRKKDLIITAGYNIYPAELEQVIATYPGVVMVAVAGIADELKGELAQAFIVRHPETDFQEDDIITYCRQHLASYKVPRRVLFVDDLPKTSTGKILRRRLAELTA